MPSTGPARSGPLPVEQWPIFEADPAPEECTAERLLAMGLGDGLPVLPPTRARLERMLAGIADPHASHGALPPLRGPVSAHAVGYQAVLAGCEPAWLDVVMAAVRACLEPEVNTLGLLTTTGTATIAVMLDDGAARAVGANAGANCLGPGNRANAAIGRAVQLSLAAIGGAFPGLVDMATMGQPGKYTFCFAEASGSPWLPPLHARRGLPPGGPAVTVVGVTGTAEIVAAWSSSPEAILETIAGSLTPLGAFSPTTRRFGGGEQFVLVPREIADILEQAGWSLARVQSTLFGLGALPASQLPAAFRRETLERNWGSPAGGADADAPIDIAASPQDVHLILTGGVGAKVTHLPTWSGGTRSVTRAVVPLR